MLILTWSQIYLNIIEYIIVILLGIIFLGLLIGNLARTYFSTWKGHQQTKSSAYRGIPSATKEFNHSWVGARHSGQCFWASVTYFIIYRTNWESRRNQRTKKQCEHEIFTNEKDPVNVENIAETLQKRNLLRHTKTIPLYISTYPKL